MRRMAPNMSSTISGERPSDGSSSSSRRGRAISARAIATICCWPPDSSPAGLGSFSFSIGNSASTCSSDSRRRALAAGRIAAELEVLEHGHAVKRRRPSGTTAMPAAQKRCGGSA